MADKIRLPCRNEDPEIWFPVGTGPMAVETEWLAQALCDGCPIKAACLQYALETGQRYGIWGGINMETQGTTLARRSTFTLRGSNEDHRTRTQLVHELASR